jgi:hypothetical protein
MARTPSLSTALFRILGGDISLPLQAINPIVKPIEVRGVNWNIPRIDEAHFTVTRLEELLRRSIDHRPSPTKAHSIVAIEFVWLDVACINQTPDHPQMAFEIGRQARIFREAKRGSVCLTQSTHENLEKSIRQLRVAQEAAERMHLGKAENLPTSHNWTSIPKNQSTASFADNRQRLFKMGRSIRTKIKDSWLSSPTRRSSAVIADTETRLPIALASIKSITQDRWFSSLWTLQEAFLSQWAYLISGEIEVLQPQAPQLRDIFETCESSSKICRASVAENVGNRGVGNLHLIGLVGLGPASRVFTCSLLDRLLTATTSISICPHMTSYSNREKHLGPPNPTSRV